jgi:hypothetical protein
MFFISYLQSGKEKFYDGKTRILTCGANLFRCINNKQMISTKILNLLQESLLGKGGNAAPG